MLSSAFLYNFSTHYSSLKHSEILELQNQVSTRDFIKWWSFHKERKIQQEDIDRVYREMSLLDAKGVEQVFADSKLFPLALLKLKNPPLCFSYRGSLKAFEQASISIVGSRNLSASIYEWAEIHLSKFLSMQKNTSVISGAALGADQLAHELAIRNHCRSISFLPSGILNLYPSSFAKQVEPMLEQGGIVLSSFPAQLEIKKYCFHQRNRWIVACGNFLFVLQAARKSGSMMSANFAKEIGTGLACLPGDVLDSKFWGSIDLLAEGAHLIRDREDLVSVHNLYKLRAY